MAMLTHDEETSYRSGINNTAGDYITLPDGRRTLALYCTGNKLYYRWDKTGLGTGTDVVTTATAPSAADTPIFAGELRKVKVPKGAVRLLLRAFSDATAGNIEAFPYEQAGGNS